MAQKKKTPRSLRAVFAALSIHALISATCVTVNERRVTSTRVLITRSIDRVAVAPVAKAYRRAHRRLVRGLFLSLSSFLGPFFFIARFDLMRFFFGSR